MINFALRIKCRRTKLWQDLSKKHRCSLVKRPKNLRCECSTPSLSLKREKLVSVRTMSLCVVVASIVHSR